MRTAAGRVVCGAVCVLAAALPAAVAQTGSPPGPDRPVVVLDALSSWRVFQTLKPPVIQLDSGLQAVTSRNAWLEKETPAAPDDWAQPGFPDGGWLRGGARATARTPYVSTIYLRGKFEVTDPAQVKDLRLSVAYYGGVIVRLNGEEIARGHLPKDAGGPAALADGYPPSAFVTDKGEILPSGYTIQQYKDALAARERRLEAVAIPAKSLRKGVNVLAIEVVRAPYHKIVDEKKSLPREGEVGSRSCPYDLSWNTCELRQVSLTAGGAGGLVLGAQRPKELQTWSGDILAPDFTSDFGNPCEALGRVVIQGPRNGWSSGKVIVGSPKAIEGLKATCSDLQQAAAGGGAAATIPSARVRVRYAVPFGRTTTNGDDRPRGASVIDSLLEAPLDSFPATEFGTVVPIWLTVQVPKDARPGQYTGQVTVEAKGEKAVSVPVSLEVADYAVPDTQDYRTWIELMQSPDTLAAEYNVPLWSEKHWGMIGDSMRYIGEIGSRVVMIPLIAQTNSGNEQSMVRFIPKADGTYDFDFSVMDRYLDTAEKNMGKPKFTVFIAWEIYLMTPKSEVKVDPNEGSYVSMEKSWLAARWGLRGKGPAVTTLDPATKEVGITNLPRFEDANSNAKAIWKSLFDELHKRMAKRGLEKTMLLGMASDYCPSKEELAVLQEVSGNLPWINHTHGGNRVGAKLNGIATVAYTAYVWNVTYAKDPGKQGFGWKRPELYAEFRRGGSMSDWPLSTSLLFPELQITGGQRGIGRIGADFWAALRDKSGQRRSRVWEKYPQSLWHSCNLSSHMLVPGPTGPVASIRYELMREGVQECEARIAIERVLTNEALKAKVPADLAARCQQLLDERVWRELKAFSDLQLTWRTYATAGNNWYYGCAGTPGHSWYAGSGWQDRTQKLYDLAGEMTKAMPEK